VTQQPKHFETSSSIDNFLRRDNFDDIALTSKHKYEHWYATLLTSIALLAAEDDVQYAYANYQPTMPDVRISVFTTNLVIVAEVDTTSDGVPVVEAVPRTSLASIMLSTSEKIDAREGRSYEWPGAINLRLTYRGLKKSIEIIVDGMNHYAADKPSPVVAFIESLTADIATGRGID